MRTQKRDGNEAEIVDALLAAGYEVMRCYTPFPVDLVVWRPGSNFLFLEVKDVTGRDRTTEAQVAFFERSQGCRRFIVKSSQEAIAAAEAWCEPGTTTSPSIG